MIKGITFEYQNVTSKNDGGFYNRIFTSDGIIRGCSMSATAKALTIQPGLMIIAGRLIWIDSATTFALENPLNNGYAALIFTIDLSGTASETEFEQIKASYIYSATTVFPELTKGNINAEGGDTIYQAQVAVVSISGGNIASIASNIGSVKLNADLLGGKAESSLSVYNAVRLNGKTEANLSVGDSAKLNGKTESGLYVGNSSKLQGYVPSDFAVRPNMQENTLYVSVNGLDAEGRGTTAAEAYRTIQYAYDNIPNWWYGPVTIQLTNGDHHNKITDSHVAFRNTVKKNIAKLIIQGTDSMNPTISNGSRFYGQFYISHGLDVDIAGVTIMPPYDDYKDSLVYVHNAHVTIYNSRILGGQSSYRMNSAGRLLRTGFDAYVALQNVSFARAQNAIEAATSVVTFSGCTVDESVGVPFLAYGGGLINFGGTNSATGAPYKNGGMVFVNGAVK